MIDTRIKNAIEQAVQANSQDQQLANKIIKWFESVARGNESLEEKESYRRRCERLYSAIEVEEHQTID